MFGRASCNKITFHFVLFCTLKLFLSYVILHMMHNFVKIILFAFILYFVLFLAAKDLLNNGAVLNY